MKSMDSYMFLFLLLISIIILVFVAIMNPKNLKTCSNEVVLLVGGCDKYGVCGVVTNKGKGFSQYPVKDHLNEVCFK
jgi:succinate-acetate transporter protein